MKSIINRYLQSALLCTGLFLCGLSSWGQPLINVPVQEAWTRDYKPFRIAGNLYYVGTYDLACYLITTPKGHILINTGVASSAQQIQAHVKALGFRFQDIKILLATHSHYDHVGAMAAIRKITGAKMMIHEKDAALLADGGNSDYNFGGKGSSFEPVRPDRELHNLDTVKLGGMEITVLHHPGHTKGACSFLFRVSDEHNSYRVLIANMPTILTETHLAGMPGYPDVARDYAYTLDRLQQLQFDIWLSSHASQFNLHKKHSPGDPYRPAAFIDRTGYDAELKDLLQSYQQRLPNK